MLVSRGLYVLLALISFFLFFLIGDQLYQKHFKMDFHMPAEQLATVTKAIVSRILLNALPACGRFLSAELVSKSNAFFLIAFYFTVDVRLTCFNSDYLLTESAVYKSAVFSVHACELAECSKTAVAWRDKCSDAGLRIIYASSCQRTYTT